jgi:predicted ATPase
MSDFQKQIANLKIMFSNDKLRNIFQHYIEYIRFPFFKNFSPNLKIDFSFPVTFLVGANGAGKSSLLHALYGVPSGYNVSKFWFSTELDPIKDIDNNRHCFIYSYKTPFTKTSAEVLTTRIKNKKDPDFWETAQPQIQYGMEIFSPNGKDTKEAGKTRWNPIDKNIVYLDFRREIGAFDKYFYFAEDPNTVTMKTKQDLIRRMAKYIDYSRKNNKQCKYYKRGICKAPIILEQEELSEINKILGKKYSEGKILEHNLYDRSESGTHNNMGFSVMFKTDFREYSEAFAGSGETAVVKLVHEIYTAHEFSLILLDEPETSLHPMAQRRLLEFLLKRTVEKKLQVVASTHSTDMVYGMPKEAVKAFYVNEINGKTEVSQNVTPEEAFYYISGKTADKANIIVEDKLAKMIIEAVLKSMGEHARNLFDLRYYPGGDSVIKKFHIPVYSKEPNNDDTYVIFDGDKRKSHFVIEDILDRNRTEENLKTLIVEQTGISNIEFSCDSDRPEQKVPQMLYYLKYYENNVFYLPCNTPEEIIWSDDVLGRADINDGDKDNIKNEANFKSRYALFSEAMFGASASNSIENAHMYFLKKWLTIKNSSYDEIVNILQIIKERSSRIAD